MGLSPNNMYIPCPLSKSTPLQSFNKMTFNNSKMLKPSEDKKMDLLLPDYRKSNYNKNKFIKD